VASSPFRFVTSSRAGQYSVWRGDQQLGYVTKIVHTVVDRGLTRTAFGWRPSTPDRKDLTAEPTREAAARALWTAQRSIR
jgi:hypothetical protein